MEAVADKKPIPRIAEVLGYVGGALALAAVLSLVTMFWSQLGAAGQVALCAAVGAAGLVGGYAMGRSQSAAGARLRQFLLFVGVAGVGGAGGLAAYHAIKAALGTTGATDVLWGTNASEWGWFAGFAAVAVAGGLVWWRERTWMQHLAYGLGVGMAALTVLPLVPIDGPDWGAGAVLTTVGVGWGVLSLMGRLEPENAGLSLASLGVIGGIGLMAAGDFEGLYVQWALWLGLAVSLGFIGASIPIQRLVPLGFGAAGTAGFAVLLIMEVFKGGTGVPIALIATGVLFVAIAVALTFVRPRGERGRPAEGEASPERRTVPLAAEALGYVGGSLLAGGVFALLSTFWVRLGIYGRIAVPAVAAAATLAGGFLIGRLDSPAAKRLEQFLLLLGTVAAAGLVGLASYEVCASTFRSTAAHTAEESAAVWGNWLGGVALAAIGGLIWWRRRTVLQHVAFGVGVFMAVSEAVTVAYWTSTAEPTQFRIILEGAVMLAVGAVWIAFTLLGRLKPPNTGLAIGSIGLWMGTQNMTSGPEGTNAWAVWLGLALWVGMVVASLPLRRGVLLGFGAAGTVLYSMQVVGELFPGRIAGPISLLVAGVVLVVMAVLAVRVLPKWRRPGAGPEGPAAAPV